AVGTLMVTLLLIALAIFVVIGSAIYFFQRSAADHHPEDVLPPAPGLRGLFAEAAPNRQEQMKMAMEAKELKVSSLIARAKNGERSVLEEVNESDDEDLYDRLLNELVQLADSEQKLLALMSYVGTHELRVNRALAAAVLSSWRKSPDRSSTSKALHFAALSDDANVYREAVEQALAFWREGKLSDVSTMELRALFDGEFWILSSGTRSSGAGFVLKRTLDSARRELEAASSGSPRVSKGDHPNEALPHGRASDTN